MLTLGSRNKASTESSVRITTAELDEYRARAASGAEKLRLIEAVFAWAADVGRDLDELTPEQRKGILQMVVDEVIVHRNDYRLPRFFRNQSGI